MRHTRVHTQPGTNPAVTEQQLLCAITESLRPWIPQIARVKYLPDYKTTADVTSKYAVLDAKQALRGFAIVSSPVGPHIVKRAVQSIEAARNALGPVTGQTVLEPLLQGYVEGCSFAVFTYRPPLSTTWMQAPWQILRARGNILQWLHDVVRLTRQAPAAADVQKAFVAPLANLAADEGFDAANRRHADRAIARLERGDWQPCHVLEHNDFWLGNILRADRQITGGYGFFVIDWGGSRLHGYAMCDLIRMAMSLRLTRRRLRRELVAHCRLLDCELEDAWGHLLAALGHLGQNLEHFPRSRYLAMAADCCRKLERTLPRTAGVA
jgi:hypothetical protein